MTARPATTELTGSAVETGDQGLGTRLSVRDAVRVALPAWAASRALGLLVMLASRHVAHPHLPATGDGHPYGPWTWDGAWYRAIGEHGYKHLQPDAVRFFPLFPLLGRVLAHATGLSVGAALLIVANAAALGYGAAVAMLAHRHVPRCNVRAAVWLTLLAPGAVVLVLPYTEALAGLLAAGYFLLVLSDKRSLQWAAVPLGLLSGLVRPTGILVAVVALVELFRRRRGKDVRALMCAALAPFVGAAVFCAWAKVAFGNAMLPFTTQTHRGLRGGVISNPLYGLLHPSAGAGLSASADIVAVGLSVALLCLAWRRIPHGVWLWAVLGTTAAVTSSHAMSLPRYLSAQFPLFIALATFIGRSRLMIGVALTASATVFSVVALAGFLGTGVL